MEGKDETQPPGTGSGPAGAGSAAIIGVAGVAIAAGIAIITTILTIIRVRIRLDLLFSLGVVVTEDAAIGPELNDHGVAQFAEDVVLHQCRGGVTADADPIAASAPTLVESIKVLPSMATILTI